MKILKFVLLVLISMVMSFDLWQLKGLNFLDDNVPGILVAIALLIFFFCIIYFEITIDRFTVEDDESQKPKANR